MEKFIIDWMGHETVIEAESEDRALDIFSQDAGYDDWHDACDRMGWDSGSRDFISEV